MTILQAIALGIIQGITEFLPVSSSAHLVLVPHWLGWSFDPQLEFTVDILLHIGTLVAVIIYFRQDVKTILLAFLAGMWNRKPFESNKSKIGWLILLATIPAGLVGIVAKEFFLGMINNHRTIASLLLVTAFVIIVAESFTPNIRIRIKDIRWIDAFVIGCFQAFAVLPGISRSGVTIVGGLLRKLTHESAAKLSFLMAIPIMLGAGLVAAIDLFSNHLLWQHWPAILAGFFSSLLVGTMSIRWLLRYLQNHSLRSFAWYCVLVGIVGILIGCNPVPIPTPTESPVHTVGVTTVTGDFATDVISTSPYGEHIDIKYYSSNRQLIKAVASGGVESGIVLFLPDDVSFFGTPLAMTNLQAIVYPGCEIDKLSADQLRSVFTGSVANWAELGGVSGPIKLAVREEGDSARSVFETLILGKFSLSPTARVLAGDDLMLQYVKDTVGSIGYGWESTLSSDVKSLNVSAEESFSIPVYAISYKESSGVLRDWLAWVQHRPKNNLPDGFKPIP